MNPQIVYAKLKTEIIPTREQIFLETIKDIVTKNVSKETAVRLLETCFKDNEHTIRYFVKKDYALNWTQDASELYKLLVGDMQLALQKSIDKKFTKRELEPKEVEVATSIKNLESRMIQLSEIKIPKGFRDFLPNGYKLGKALDYYKKYESFHINIILDKDNNLKEGYIKYLLCKMLDIQGVLCYNTATKQE